MIGKAWTFAGGNGGMSSGKDGSTAGASWGGFAAVGNAFGEECTTDVAGPPPVTSHGTGEKDERAAVERPSSMGGSRGGQGGGGGVMVLGRPCASPAALASLFQSWENNGVVVATDDGGEDRHGLCIPDGVSLLEERENNGDTRGEVNDEVDVVLDNGYAPPTVCEAGEGESAVGAAYGEA